MFCTYMPLLLGWLWRISCLSLLFTVEGRQWNNDLNSWTGFNGQYLEGGLVAWGNADYGGTPTEPIGYAFSDDDKLLQ